MVGAPKLAKIGENRVFSGFSGQNRGFRAPPKIAQKPGFRPNLDGQLSVTHKLAIVHSLDL